MDTNPNTMTNDGEIDLRRLFMALWRRKVFIICITLIFGILAGLFSKFVISPVYRSNLNIVINMPEIYHTKYGDYTYPITSNQQYMDLIVNNDILLKTIEDMEYDDVTLEDLRNRIVVGIVAVAANAEHNSFEVSVAAGSPTEAKKLAQTLYKNYIEFIDMMTVEGAINYYTDFYDISLKTLKDELESNHAILLKNNELLAITPQTINQKDAMEEIQKLTDTTEYIVLENIINPNYTAIESTIISIKQSIIDIENNISKYTKYLDELDQVKSKVLAYNESGDFEQLDGSFVSASKSNIYLISEPVAPNQKTSPSNIKNAIIGAMLGGMLAVFIALIREYWFKEELK